MQASSENSRKRINFDVVPMNAVICKKRKISESSTASSTGSSTLNKATTSKKRRYKKARMDSSLPNILGMDCQATPKCRPKRDYQEIDNILSEIELELKPKTKKLNKSLPSKLSKASKAPKFTIIESSDSEVSTASVRTPQKSNVTETDVQTSISSTKSKASKKKSNKNKKEDLQNLLKLIKNDLSKEGQNYESDKSCSNKIKDLLPEDIVYDNTRFNKKKNADALLTDSEEAIKGKKKKSIEQRATITKGKDENMINILDVVTVNQKDHPVKKSVKGSKCLRKVNEELAINLKEQDDDKLLMIKESTGSVKHNIKKSAKKKEEHKNVINLDILTNDFKLEKEKSPDDKKSKRKKKSNIIRIKINELLKFKSPNTDQKRLGKEDEELVNAQELVDGNVLMIKESPESSMEMLNSVENLQNVNLTKVNDGKKQKTKQILKCGNLTDDEELYELNNQKKSVEETIKYLNESMNIKIEDSINEPDIHHELIIKQSPVTSAAEMDSEDEQLHLQRNTMVCLEKVNNNENNSEKSTETIINKQSDSRLTMSEQYSEKATKQNRGAEFEEVLTVNNISQKDIETTLCSPSVSGKKNILSIQTENTLREEIRSTVLAETCKRNGSECKINEIGIFKKSLTPETRENNNADIEQQFPMNDLQMSLSDNELNCSVVIKSFNRKNYLKTKKHKIKHNEPINSNKTMSSSIHFDVISDCAQTSTQLDVISSIKMDSAKPGSSKNYDEKTNDDDLKEMLKIETMPNEVLSASELNDLHDEPVCEGVVKDANQSKLDKKYAALDNIVEDCVQSLIKCKAEKKERNRRKLMYVGRQDLNRVLKNDQNKLVKNVERGCKPIHNIKNISFDTQKMITEAVRMAILKRDWDSIPYLLSHAMEMGNSYFPGYISETLMMYLMVRRNEGNNEVLLEECQKLMFRKMTEKDKISELVMHLDEE